MDELYSGEWGEHEDKIRSVVQSRVGTGRYVQEEVFAQADLVWSIVNSVDGRVFVCGSSKGMGEGVHESLVKVVMKKSKLGREQAEEFWEQKKTDGQYIAVCRPSSPSFSLLFTTGLANNNHRCRKPGNSQLYRQP